ncbi:mycothiol S-conjugate amidase [Arcanobacterium wilhelmae]|uniref:Mycothiol S-conjugate amidase n=1 Tax=Arcanobacterium wilhelmae TaxID=1803177 RepID=A0ABT9NC19_9ACTO|nr:mycothiol conjugate amidase Mca [Arcanobacterium wilhelmae]MDP9801253.1 mycothiol S-conjugate amidase [Arcanobacterium wilhelmae]WFN90599.1 mycothiol conjugate amidase Mca [Arcanobacterium wilhelmae]
MTDQRRLMAVHAHPDDEASKGAGTLAKYAHLGRVRVVTATGGERGSILNPALVGNTEIAADLPGYRRREMAASVAALGVEHVWLGFEDSGLPEGDPLPPLPAGCFAAIGLDAPTRALVAQIREFRPQVLITYDERGGYPHPDHIRTHVISMAAVAAASDPNYAPEIGEPWRVSKVYYDAGFSVQRMRTLDSAMVAAGLPAVFTEWVHHAEGHPSVAGEASIDVAEFFPARDAALAAHATQIDPNGIFFAVPRDLEARVWPWEQFHLALSSVGWADAETDLFERIDGLEPIG